MSEKTMVSMLKVIGPRVKVRVDAPKEEKSAGGIITLTGDKTEDNETGVVTQLGHCAYGNYSAPWCNVGDKVLFQRYAGKPREEVTEDGSMGYFRVLKDVDVIAVIHEREVKPQNEEVKK